MEARRQVTGGPYQLAELPPEEGGELRLPVRDHVQVNYVLNQQLGHLRGRGKFLEGNKVSHLTESINDGEYDRVPL